MKLFPYRIGEFFSHFILLFIEIKYRRIISNSEELAQGLECRLRLSHQVFITENVIFIRETTFAVEKQPDKISPSGNLEDIIGASTAISFSASFRIEMKLSL